MKKNFVVAGVIFAVIAGALWSIESLFKQKPDDIKSTSAQPEKPIVDLSTTSTTLLLPHGSADLILPERYSVSIAATGLGRARFMAMSPDSRLFITDMHDLSDNSVGNIYILSDLDLVKHVFNTKKVYLANLRNPNSIAFYKDPAGKEWLYIALTDRLIRYPYSNSDDTPTQNPETLSTFPDYGLSYKYGGWHLTRTVAIHNDQVYIAIGSSCNSCEEKEEVRASIVVMDLDGKNQHQFAKGLRNAVGIKWVDDEFYATDMGADHLGTSTPNEMLYKLADGADYGWPYCYVKDGKVLADSTIIWKKTPTDCTQVPEPMAYFPAHAAPFGLEYFDQTFKDPMLKDNFLVGLHGSGVVNIGTGNSVVIVHKDGTVTDFMTGFLKDKTRLGRPVDILRYDDRSMFVSDDYNGVIYFVSYIE